MPNQAQGSKGGWTLHVFGRPKVTGGNQVFDQFGTRRAVQLLARLAMSTREFYSRSEAAALLWPDDHYDATRLRLRQELTRLRRGLGPASRILETDEEKIGIDRSTLQIDYERFKRLAGLAAKETEDPARVAACLEALSLSSQPLMEGHSEHWIDAERHQIEAIRYSLQVRLAESYSRLGNEQAALETAIAATRAEPAEEEGHFLLMKVLSEHGHPSDALGQLELLRNALREDRSSALSQEAKTLAAAIRNRPARLLPAPMPVSSGIKFAVPSPVDPIYGREKLVAHVAGLVSSVSPRRVVSLIGPGGIGKTRVAQEVAVSLQDDYLGRVAWVDLADTANAGDFASDLAAALGVVLSPRADPIERIASLMHAQPALLVLDNLEQLLPDVLKDVSSLLGQSAKLHMLVTSRSALNMRGEQRVVVDPLPLPSDDDEANQPCLRLFLDTAQAEPGFRPPSREEVPLLRQIARRLEGIPLSLQLASTRLRTLSYAELLDQLMGRIEIVNRSQNAPRRQRSIREAVAGSYRALGDEQKRMLGRLSVFRGGWNKEAAAAVCETDDPLPVIEDLLDASLIRTDRDEATLRFRMLETVREGVQDDLSPEDLTRARELHADWVLQLGEAATLGSYYSSHKAFDLIDLEKDNLREAARYCLEHNLEKAVRLGAAYGRYWYGRALTREGLAFYETLFAAADLSVATEEIARAAYAQARLMYISQDYMQSDMDSSVSERAQAICKAAGLEVEAAMCWIQMARTPFLKGEYDRALEFLKTAEARIRELGENVELGVILAMRGMVLHYQGKVQDAISALVEAEDLFGSEGPPFHRTQTPMMLAFMNLEVGEVDLASAHADRALELAEEFGFRHIIPMIQEAEGRIAVARGDLARATEWFQTSADNWGFFGNTYQVADQLNHLARVQLLAGNPEEALRLAGQAAGVWRGLGLRPVLPCALSTAAKAYALLGKPEKAARLLGAIRNIDFTTRDGEQASEISFLSELQSDLETALGAKALEIVLSESHGFDEAIEEAFS